jgi:hypothetical protein
MPAALGVERSKTAVVPSGVTLGGPFSESAAAAGGWVI